MIADNKYIRSLIESAQSGKVVALEELYQMNINRIYAIALRITANVPLASALSFNVLLDAWQQLKKIRSEISFADWLKGIAVHNTLQEMKTGELKRDKKKKLFKTDNNVEQLLSDQVEKAISKLADDERLIVVLNKIESYSLAEIADLLNSPEKEVQKKLTDGLREIKKSLSVINISTDATDAIKNLPKEIKSDGDIIVQAMEKIREVKVEEYREPELPEEIEEEPEDEKPKIKETKEEKPERKKLKINKKFIWGGLTVLVLIVAVYFLTTSTKVWQVSSKSGTPSINNKALTQNEQFSRGDIVSTDASSTALIEIPDIGDIEIFSGTSFKRLEGNYSAKLVNGKVNVNNENATERFSIEIPPAMIEDFYMANKYSVIVDERGNTIIEVTSGWLRIFSETIKSIVPQGYTLKVIKDAGISLPFRTGSNPEYSKLSEDFLFGGKKDMTLDLLLTASSNTEAITLWNLLKRVEGVQREATYNRLHKLVPHPDAVKKKGILNLNPEMLQIWLEEIEWQM